MSAESIRVVIADDDPEYRRLLDRLITNWGYQSVVAHNGFEASQILLAEPDTNLAVFDWEMPTMDGVAACRYVRQHRNADDLYIMMVTVKNETENLVEAFEAGANDMLGKSFHPMELKARLASAGRRLASKRRRVKEVLNDRQLLNGKIREEGASTAVSTLSHEWLAPLNLPTDCLAPGIDKRSLKFSHRIDEGHLEEGAKQGMLSSKLLDRALVCPRCESLPSFRHGCPCCGSGRVEQELLIHHFACAHVGRVEDFETPDGIACTKCRAKHLMVGADFEYQRGPLRCLDCQWSPRELELVGHCLRCGFRFPAQQALVKDLMAYTPRGPHAFLPLATGPLQSHLANRHEEE